MPFWSRATPAPGTLMLRTAEDTTKVTKRGAWNDAVMREAVCSRTTTTVRSATAARWSSTTTTVVIASGSFATEAVAVVRSDGYAEGDVIEEARQAPPDNHVSRWRIVLRAE